MPDRDKSLPPLPPRIEGFVIVSADGMIAGGDGEMPASMLIEADQEFLHACLDGAAVVVHGRFSGEGGAKAAGRRRIVVTRRVAALAPDPGNPRAVLWNPKGAPFEDALAMAGVSGGLVAILGGSEIFGIFLPHYDAFHLSRAGKVRLPGGRPVFPQVPQHTPEDVLTNHNMIPDTPRVLDAAADCTLVTWRRSRP